MSEILDAAAFFGGNVTGTHRDLALAGFKLGIEHAAKIIAVCTDEHIDATLASGAPQECLAVAAMLVRHQGREAIATLELRQRPAKTADVATTNVCSAAVGAGWAPGTEPRRCR